MKREPIQIISRAPVRIDVAGGTVDIWPLYLLLPHPKTVNFGIDLFAETKLTAQESKTPLVRLVSADLGIEETWQWNDLLADKEPNTRLALPLKLLRYFSQKVPNAQTQDITLTTTAKSPSGAGLGGSSALSISLIGALFAWANPNAPLDLKKDGEHLIALTRDVESQVLYGPAGLQDYYGAAYGGLQILEWKLAQNERRSLGEEALRWIADRTLLFYSGQSRNSGINNWQLFQGLINKSSEVEERFLKICAATETVVNALESLDANQLLNGVNAEWAARRQLANGISTPDMDQALIEAKKKSEVAFKVCGAGGGGCFFVLLPDADPKRRSAVQQAVLAGAKAIRELPFQPVASGLTVTSQNQL
jgi:D-glycero-alpha-D-manno-heptose-7-phosphate kinase